MSVSTRAAHQLEILALRSLELADRVSAATTPAAALANAWSSS
jgi:hypothetical protein